MNDVFQGCDQSCTAEGGYPALCEMYPEQLHPGCPRQVPHSLPPDTPPAPVSGETRDPIRAETVGMHRAIEDHVKDDLVARMIEQGAESSQFTTEEVWLARRHFARLREVHAAQSLAASTSAAGVPPGTGEGPVMQPPTDTSRTTT